MEIPITELLDYENSVEWILKHFHPKGLQCPNCHSPIEHSREFRRTKSSELASPTMSELQCHLQPIHRHCVSRKPVDTNASRLTYARHMQR